MVYVSCQLRDGGTSVRKCLFLLGGQGGFGGMSQHNSSLGEAYFRRFKATRFSGLFEEALPGSAQERWRRWWRESDWLKLIAHLWPITGDSAKLLFFYSFCFWWEGCGAVPRDRSGSCQILEEHLRNCCQPDSRRLKAEGSGLRQTWVSVEWNSFKGWLQAFSITGSLAFTDLWF